MGRKVVRDDDDDVKGGSGGGLSRDPVSRSTVWGSNARAVPCRGERDVGVPGWVNGDMELTMAVRVVLSIPKQWSSVRLFICWSSSVLCLNI